jgi:Na+/H+ antiporter NhaD/arsenite permease-like protein
MGNTNQIDCKTRKLIFLPFQQVSALASAFVDNIPLTTMMVKIAISLAENEALNLPLQPLVWALAFGACLGGLLNYNT